MLSFLVLLALVLVPSRGVLIQMITPAFRNVTTNQNQSVQIPCTARGIPRPTITWKRKNGRSLRGRVATRNTRNYNEKVTSTLTISQVQTRDAGVYICTATNTAPTRPLEQEITLVVREPTQMIKPIKKNIIISNPNQYAQIQCVARGIPRPTFTWRRKDGQRLRGRVTHAYANLYYTISTIMISRVETRDAGDYICIATNSLQTTNQQVKLVVQVPFTRKGSIFIHPESQQKSLNDIGLMECLVSGYPQESIKWKKNGKTIITDEYHINVSTTKTTNETVRSILSITSVVRADNGTYICEASNTLGGLCKTSSLLILEKPDQLIVNAAQIHNSVSLTWLVTYDGNSPITGIYIEHSDNIGTTKMYSVCPEQGDRLQINNLKLGVKHFFSVEAENRVGRSDPATVAVNLLSPAKAQGSNEFRWIQILLPPLLAFIAILVAVVVFLKHRLNIFQKQTLSKKASSDTGSRTTRENSMERNEEQSYEELKMETMNTAREPTEEHNYQSLFFPTNKEYINVQNGLYNNIFDKKNG